MAVQRVVASIMLLAFSTIYLGTMVLGNHAYSEILVTVDAFVCVICALNIDNIVAVSRTFPAAALCGWIAFFLFQLYAVYFVAVNEDVNATTVTRIWFQMDCLVAILCFCVVLTHCVLMCAGGGGGSYSNDTESEYVAIRVGNSRRKTSTIPTSGRSLSSGRAMRGGSKLPNGLAF